MSFLLIYPYSNIFIKLKNPNFDLILFGLSSLLECLVTLKFTDFYMTSKGFKNSSQITTL